MSHHKGFALLEITVTLAVLAIALPSATQALLGVQRYFHARMTDITRTHEQRYCAQFVRREVHDATSIDMAGPTQLRFTDSLGRSVAYLLEKGQFKRRQTQWQNGKSTLSTQILNDRWPVTQLAISRPFPHVIRISIGTSEGMLQWEIYIPNDA